MSNLIDKGRASSNEVIQGLTEPNHGSDPAGMETTAEEVDGGFILNGSKTWISNAPAASVCLPLSLNFTLNDF